MTLEEIRKLISDAEIKFSPDAVCKSGVIVGASGDEREYAIYKGWSAALANQCDEMWGEFNFALVSSIKNSCADELELSKALGDVYLEDSHWDWFNKSLHYSSESYQWFFLCIDGVPEGACLIYHPKISAITGDNIYYIEYIAVAPWNRPNPIEAQRYRGVGTSLIQAACLYANKELRLRYGFSLHSLPKAVGFYKHIGMTHIPANDKGPLAFFEMCETKATVYAEAS
jgi:hypothetical protein